LIDEIELFFNFPIWHSGHFILPVHSEQKTLEHFKLSHFLEFFPTKALHFEQKSNDILSISIFLILHISFIKFL